MDLKIKLLSPNAVLPKYAKPGDAGLDLVATSKEEVAGQTVYGTGIAVEIPEGYVGLIFPRSSIKNYTMSLSNSVGVIDSGYRGEIKFAFNHLMGRGDMWPGGTPIQHKHYEVGEKIGQLMILPYPTFTVVQAEELSSSERGAGGFGSTGK